ncbi:oxygenase MpaB family protein [Micromonospora sp. NPDC049051]|uniref:oxygenase MpaB family protein n=1 Tax=Micromonospora sp. NPDC049051 TaxID=3364264 RepID=UPI00371668B8
MENLSRRGILTLGAALGLVAVTETPKAWAWSSANSIAGTNSVTDPWDVWDDDTDPLLVSLLDNGQIPAVNNAFKSYIKNGDAIPAGLPPALTNYLRTHNKLPAWADQAKLDRAAAFNKRMSLYLFVLYGLGSGIMSTVIPREARNVYWSEGGADMKSRAAKTFTYGYDLNAPDAFKPSGMFITTSTKTRLTHAAVRHLLPQSAAWRGVTDHPIPISNGDILITFHSLGTYVHRKLTEWRRFGLRISAAEEEAFLHMWQVALYLLGVRQEFIPATWAAAYEQSEYALTPLLAPTREGIDLADILLNLTSSADLGITKGFQREFSRYVLSDEIGNWLRLPRDFVSRGVIETAWPTFVMFREGLSPVMPGTFSMFDKFIRGLAMLFLNNGTSASHTPITIPTHNRPGA